MPSIGRDIYRFNPCFDGSVARGLISAAKYLLCSSFNPCFDGSVARGPCNTPCLRRRSRVSILVLMEV